jgi:hypothetical protein
MTLKQLEELFKIEDITFKTEFWPKVVEDTPAFNSLKTGKNEYFFSEDGKDFLFLVESNYT